MKCGHIAVNTSTFEFLVYKVVCGQCPIVDVLKVGVIFVEVYTVDDCAFMSCGDCAPVDIELDFGPWCKWCDVWVDPFGDGKFCC